MEQAFRAQLEPWLKGPRPEPIRPFHWPLEFPEVMDNGGFSAVVSNPPFMGGQTLTGRLGEDLREYLINYIGRGKRGSADLCSYFLLRDLSVARKGRVGIIATNTIAQGDTREVGLDQVSRRPALEHLPRRQIPTMGRHRRGRGFPALARSRRATSTASWTTTWCWISLRPLIPSHGYPATPIDCKPMRAIIPGLDRSR